MTRHTRWSKVVLAVILTLCFATAVAADGTRPRLETPRHVIREHALRSIQPQGQVMPLGIGNAHSFAMGDTWITSDQLTDDYSTDIAFYTDENLAVFLWFYSLTDKNVTISIQVKDSSGTTVFTDGFTVTPGADAINYTVLDLGMYTEGPYKIIVKVKQGSKIIGQQHWFAVFTPTN
jgi:hypothetical protein